jgi:hypothetical protein
METHQNANLEGRRKGFCSQHQKYVNSIGYHYFSAHNDRCLDCNHHVSAKSWIRHCTSRKHIRNEMLQGFLCTQELENFPIFILPQCKISEPLKLEAEPLELEAEPLELEVETLEPESFFTSFSVEATNHSPTWINYSGDNVQENFEFEENESFSSDTSSTSEILEEMNDIFEEETLIPLTEDQFLFEVIQSMESYPVISSASAPLTDLEQELCLLAVKWRKSREEMDGLVEFLKKNFDTTGKILKNNFKGMKLKWCQDISIRMKQIKINAVKIIKQKKKKNKLKTMVDYIPFSPTIHSLQEKVELKFTLFSAEDLLSSFLISPLGKTSLISTYTPSSIISHPCSGNWFKNFCDICPPGKIPLALIVFFDPFEAVHSVSRGAYVLSILNLEKEALLSPASKITLAVLPQDISITMAKPHLVEDLLQLEQNGLEITSETGEILSFFIRIAFPSGDSKDLNGFIGIGGFNSLSGCRKCWIPLSELSNCEPQFQLKTADQIKVYHSMCEQAWNSGFIAGAKRLFKKYSIPQGGLSAFFTLNGDWCQWSPRDILHAERLGLLKREFIHILFEKVTPEQFQRIAKELTQISPPKGGVNLGNSLQHVDHYLGKQIETLVWCLPIALSKVIDTQIPWFQCLCSHLQYYRLLSQTEISTTDVVSIKYWIKLHHQQYYHIYPQDFTYEVNDTIRNKAEINFHHTFHLVEDMELFGAAVYFSTELFENKIQHLKQATKMTNGQNPSEHVPKIDHIRSIKFLWNSTLEDLHLKKINTPHLNWLIKVAKSPKIPPHMKYYVYNSVTIEETTFTKGDFLLVHGFKVVTIKEVWGTKNAFNISAAQLKVQTYTNLEPHPTVGLWSVATFSEEETIISLEQIFKKVKGWQTNDIWCFDFKFRMN